LPREKNLQALCLELIREGLIHSAHDCAEGGLAVTLAEKCFAPGRRKGWGARVEIKNGVPLPALLFGESQGRILVSCPPASVGRIEEKAETFQVPFEVLGTVTGDRLIIACDDQEGIDMDVSALEEAWRTAIGKNFN